MTEVAEKVEFLLRGAVEEQGLELVHVQFLGRRRSPLLRVYIDKPGGVTLEDCQSVSRQAGVLLDVGDLISGRSVLEGSSPSFPRGGLPAILGARGPPRHPREDRQPAQVHGFHPGAS